MKCKSCPYVVGDIFKRDCGFPECLGWEIYYSEEGVSFWLCEEGNRVSDVFTTETWKEAEEKIVEYLKIESENENGKTV